MRKIGIIGTGRLGTRLAEQLIIDGIVDEIALFNRSEKKLIGTFASLEVWARMLNSSIILSAHSIEDLDSEVLLNYDAFIIAIKEKYDPRDIDLQCLPEFIPRELRYAGIFEDIKLFEELGHKLSGYSGYLLVVSNPLDVVTSLFNKWAPCAKVLGLGSTLDSARMSFEFWKTHNISVSPSQCILCGEHGTSLIPVSEAWIKAGIGGYLTKEEFSRLASNVGKLGVDIVKCLGYTLQDCSLVFSRDLDWILNNRFVKSEVVASFSVFRKSACVGLPLQKNYQSWEIEKSSCLAPGEEGLLDETEFRISSILEQL